MPDPISWAYVWPFFTTALVGAYLVGTIPTGLLLTRLAGLGDIRRMGSGNIGATNVLRSGRVDIALLTLLGDAGKGALAVLIARNFGPDLAVTAGFGAVIGHMFPIWLRFRGGKGVATTLGVLLVLAWPVGLAALAAWLLAAAITRYASVASLIAVAAAPVFAWNLDFRQEAELAVVLALLVWLAHHSNFRRLFKGEEDKIGAGWS